MKKLLLLPFLITAGLATTAQSDTLFPNIAAYWNVKSVTYDPGTFYGSYKCFLLSDDFDTLGKTWSTMIDDGWNNIGWVAVDSGCVYYKATGPIGNGLGDVYDDPSVYKMYDFNLEVGDTAYYDDGYPMVIQNITISTFLGIPKRTFELSTGQGHEDTWVEGLGSTDGFFRPVFTSFETDFSLCFFNGEYVDSLGVTYSLAYDNPDECENLSVEIPDHVTTFTVGDDWVSIDSPESSELVVYAITGNVVLRSNINEGKTTVDLSDLKPGVYILHSDQNVNRKFQKR
jgi:hypothetical protein